MGNTCGYDALDRLTSWTLNNGTPETYTYDANGNLDVKAGVDLNYNDASHVHAVTHIGSTQKYWYDANGNQITRVIGADTYTLLYDAENRLVEVKKNAVSMAVFVYDGDGQRVKSTINGTTTYFVGAHYEVSGSTVTKYYFAGAQRVAMRSGSTLSYLLSDHLGSTSLTTDANGTLVSEMRYKPWGEVRASNGTTPTNYTYTGQYSNMGDFGLMFYNARWYDPSIGRFAQADTTIPLQQGVQAWDRYAYVNNNPLLYNDPSGHTCVLGIILGALGGSYACPAPLDPGPYIFVGGDDEGGAYINVPIPADATPGWIVDPPLEPLDTGVLINVPAPADDWQEGFDPLPNGNDLKIIAETDDRTPGRLPIPPTPEGMSVSEFGQDVMQWGTGNDEAIERIDTITAEELDEAGVTVEMAEAWRDFHINESARNPRNPSASGRAELMQYVVDLLGER